MPSSDHSLPPAESDVIACLHRLGEATARQIREALELYRPMRHESVLSLLKRLEAKQLVCKRKGPVGKAFVYRTRQKPQATFRGLIRQLLHRAFSGDSVALMAALYETKAPTADELDKLEELLNELRKRTAKRNQK